jgi:hypothetical protein
MEAYSITPGSGFEQDAAGGKSGQCRDAVYVPLNLPFVAGAVLFDFSARFEIDNRPSAIREKREIDDSFERTAVCERKQNGHFAVKLFRRASLPKQRMLECAGHGVDRGLHFVARSAERPPVDCGQLCDSLVGRGEVAIAKYAVEQFAESRAATPQLCLRYRLDDY